MAEPDGKIATFIVRHMLDQIERRGLEAETLMRSAGVRSAQIDNTVPWVPLSLCCDLIRAAIAATGDPQLGLRISQSVFPTGFGIVGHLILACPVLGDVVDAVGRYEKLIGDIFTSTLVQEPGASIWCLDVHGCPPDVTLMMTEFGIATRSLLLSLVRERRANIVTEVRFRHAPPGTEDMAIYETVFHCPVRFNQPHSGLVLKPEALALPLLHTERGLKWILEAEADKLLAERQHTPDVVTRARERLALLVREGTASRDALAADMGISGRHLHRELALAGTSYSEILGEIRLARARELLGTDITLEQVGKQLGFQEASSFMRWYRQQTGQTAGAARGGKNRKE